MIHNEKKHIMRKYLLLLLVVFALMGLSAQNMPTLRKGDTIAIVAPSGKVEPSQVLPAVQYFQSQVLVSLCQRVFTRITRALRVLSPSVLPRCKPCWIGLV